DVKIELNENGFVRKVSVNDRIFEFTYSENSIGGPQEVTISSQGNSIVLKTTTGQEKKPESWKATLKGFMAGHDPAFTLSVKTNKKSFEQLLQSLNASSWKENSKNTSQDLRESLKKFSKSYAELASKIKPEDLSAEISTPGSRGLESNIRGF